MLPFFIKKVSLAKTKGNVQHITRFLQEADGLHLPVTLKKRCSSDLQV